CIQRHTGWQNADFERFIEEARHLTDHAARLRLYKQADAIIMREAPVIPAYYSATHLLVKPWVKRFPIPPIGALSWKDVIIESH
ncbi:MAG: peptide ABC transporter substrate-binding protein, partial [Anaerolineae bacterium]|nr:peptide ABC transporter substrate-binding protein [Anaerolineae bacterium]